MTTARKKAKIIQGFGKHAGNAPVDATFVADRLTVKGPDGRVLVDVQRPRGRPVTTGTTPAKDRKAKERATATEQGGGRLNINLTPLAAEDLAALQARWPSMTKTQIVNSALHAYRRGL